MNSLKRLHRDMNQLRNNPLEGIEAMLIDEKDFYEWVAYIKGPDNTCWEGGIFKLSLKFGNNYPTNAPSVKFVTPMFHPNVYKSGEICLDLLQNNWSPINNVSSILLSIQSLLTDPNCQSLANSEAGRLYLDNKLEYAKKVEEIVEASLDMVEKDFPEDDDDEFEDEDEGEKKNDDNKIEEEGRMVEECEMMIEEES